MEIPHSGGGDNCWWGLALLQQPLDRRRNTSPVPSSLHSYVLLCII